MATINQIKANNTVYDIAGNATNVAYDNTTSGLEALTVQSALDELNNEKFSDRLSIPTDVDLNDYMTIGSYNCSTTNAGSGTVANTPFTTAFFMNVYVRGKAIMQEATVLNTGKTKKRFYSSGTWGEWKSQALESEVNECFQSVSDGKAAVASAITDKGVTTASDATFATMATNIGKISTGERTLKKISLGSKTGNGNYTNVKTICEENDIDFSTVTKSNFILCVTGVASLSQQDNTVWTTGNAKVDLNGSSPKISAYDASTGKVTVTGAQQTGSVYLNGQSTSTSFTQKYTYTVYLVY